MQGLTNAATKYQVDCSVSGLCKRYLNNQIAEWCRGVGSAMCKDAGRCNARRRRQIFGQSLHGVGSIPGRQKHLEIFLRIVSAL